MAHACEFQNKCRFLKLDEEQACSMTKGGIYIPLSEHIEMFCKTPHYIECEQYILGNKLKREFPYEEYYFDNGRRQFRRIPDILALTLSSCDESGRPCQILDANASTLDLSPGGMQLQSSRNLLMNNLIAFTFGPHFSTPNHTGVGQICWSSPANTPDTYNAGLSFIDASTKQVLGQHMGISV